MTWAGGAEGNPRLVEEVAELRDALVRDVVVDGKLVALFANQDLKLCVLRGQNAQLVVGFVMPGDFTDDSGGGWSCEIRRRAGGGKEEVLGDAFEPANFKIGRPGSATREQEWHFRNAAVIPGSAIPEGSVIILRVGGSIEDGKALKVRLRLRAGGAVTIDVAPDDLQDMKPLTRPQQ